MSKIIKTDKILLSLDGKTPIKNGEEDMTLGMAIGLMLTQEHQSDKLRAFSLGMSYYKGADIAETDIPFVEEAVKKSQIFTPIVTGQILGLLKPSE